MLKGLATGVGSLPHKDVENALDLIFKHTAQIPFWPQLPKRDRREGMIVQFCENLPCLKVREGGLFFEPREKEKELEIFYERIIAGDIDYFKLTQDFALGLHKFFQGLEKQNLQNIEFIKCQLTGPFTFAGSLKDEKGIALLHDGVFMQAIIKGLIMKALWQVKFFEKFKKKIILFIDEPYLGCFGSAYTSINREDVIKGLNELTEAIRAENVLLGVHCCGNTDWSIFTDIPNIKIINFDAFSFLDKFVLYAEHLKGFLKREGMICWGMVPTQEFTGQQTANLLVRKLKDGIDTLVKKGIDKDLLLENLLISPSCGLGSLDSKKAEQILDLLSNTSSLARESL